MSGWSRSSWEGRRGCHSLQTPFDPRLDMSRVNLLFLHFLLYLASLFFLLLLLAVFEQSHSFWKKSILNEHAFQEEKLWLWRQRRKKRRNFSLFLFISGQTTPLSSLIGKHFKAERSDLDHNNLGSKSMNLYLFSSYIIYLQIARLRIKVRKNVGICRRSVLPHSCHANVVSILHFV